MTTTPTKKTVAFAEAPAGAIGLELALPLLWHNLWKLVMVSLGTVALS